jgi:SPP1 family predicted phage head-tail adaptor
MAVNRLNHKIEFGTVQSVPNEQTGDYDSEFIPTLTVHCALYQRSQTQQYALVGTRLDYSIVVAIRSRSEVTDQLKARFVGKTVVYSIADVSQDASGQPVAYDLVTLKKMEKVG